MASQNGLQLQYFSLDTFVNGPQSNLGITRMSDGSGQVLLFNKAVTKPNNVDLELEDEQRSFAFRPLLNACFESTPPVVEGVRVIDRHCSHATEQIAMNANNEVAVKDRHRIATSIRQQLQRLVGRIEVIPRRALRVLQTRVVDSIVDDMLDTTSFFRPTPHLYPRRIEINMYFPFVDADDDSDERKDAGDRLDEFADDGLFLQLQVDQIVADGVVVSPKKPKRWWTSFGKHKNDNRVSAEPPNNDYLIVSSLHCVDVRFCPPPQQQ